MIPSGGVAIRDLPILGIFLSSIAKKETDIAKSFGKDFLDKEIDKFN